MHTFDRVGICLRPLPGEDGSGCYIIGAIIGAAGSLIGGSMASDAAEEAAERQEAAQARNLEFAREIYGEQRADTAPYRAAGSNAVNRLQYLLGLGAQPGAQAQAAPAAPAYAGPSVESLQGRRGELERLIQGFGERPVDPGSGEAQNIWAESGGRDRLRNYDAQTAGLRGQISDIDAQMAAARAAQSAPAQAVQPAAPGAGDGLYGDLMRSFGEEDFRADPGYQYRLEQGEQAINRGAAARGMYSNPATVRELNRHGQGLADQTYGDAFNRYQLEQGNRFNRLAALAGIGQTGVGQTMGAGANFLNAGTAANTGMGNAAAGGLLNAANARISGLTGATSGIADAYNVNSMLRRFGGGGTPANAYPGVTYPGQGGLLRF